MFSAGTNNNKKTKKKKINANADNNSPITPHRISFDGTAVPNRPSTGTPAPWAPSLSLLARVPQVTRTSHDDGSANQINPVFVADFPQLVRDHLSSFLHKRRLPVEDYTCGGIDKSTSLAWIICGNKVFIWSYLSPASMMKCVVLEIPCNSSDDGDVGTYDAGSWLLCVVNCDSASVATKKVAKHCNSAAVVLCNRKTRTVIYWSDIYSQLHNAPVTSFASSDELEAVSIPDRKTSLNRQRRQNNLGSGLNGLPVFNSLIASAVPDRRFVCVALACSSNGELWQFHCNPSDIHRRKVCENIVHFPLQEGDSGQFMSHKGYPRSLTWCSPHRSSKESNRQFLVLTDHEIQCFRLEFGSDVHVSKLWSQEIVGTDAEVGIKKDLAGQKETWLLDVKVDDHGRVFTILFATFCKDRISSSSYLQYSLLTMQNKSGLGVENTNDRILEKKAPIEVIIPKARVEDKDFLFSMRLRVGGKPSGSTVIISGDGTATVSHYRNSTRLYQFDLPNDAGKVLDVSILPSADDHEEGAWVVLTERAGIWAIPEKAVILGGVEPPGRSLSRKGSSNERSAQEEIRNQTFASNFAPRRASSEAWGTGDRQRAAFGGIARRTAQDEESEALLHNLFNEFLSSGQVGKPLEKLETSGSFERDGETNVFVRMSKSIVDTLAKHWTTTRGAEILAMAAISTQLLEKQQKHQKFLQFLALSKCHEELCSRQRHALQIILEHGEKLSAMTQLRELQNLISQNRSPSIGYSNSSSGIQMSGALWDMIQLVGERARRNTVLLMDRDNADVFYSKVSDLEDFFYCLDAELEYVISPEHPSGIQIQRACELSNACVTIIRTCFNYKNENHLWYPPPEGLTPWYCLHVVRKGVWSVASILLQLLNGNSGLDKSAKLDLYNHLEALAEVLLEAYSGAVTAKIECEEEHSGLLNEYWVRRDELLESLYQQVKEFEAIHKGSIEGAEEQGDEAIMKVMSHLLSIAKRHGCYKVMWTICCDVNDSELLRSIMRESLGPNGGFSNHVFKKLHESLQFSELLRLGEEFPEELSIFLREHPDLLWLHDLFLHQFSSASETLHSLALTQNLRPTSVVEEEEQEYMKLKLNLVDRKKLLYLSKIAAFAAGKDAGTQVKMDRVEADLKILKLQEEVMKHLHSVEDKQLVEHQLLHPEDLIKLCLKSEEPELSLWAFDVFAWTSSSFRKIHRKLLEDCWKKAASEDDWSKLHETSVIEGWSEEETQENLKHTILFQASSRCYGPRAETYGEGFDQVLPLRQENLENPIPGDMNSSVETILMQHKDFGDAGKLMLMAIMLGTELDGDIKLEGGPSPME